MLIIIGFKKSLLSPDFFDVDKEERHTDWVCKREVGSRGYEAFGERIGIWRKRSVDEAVGDFGHSEQLCGVLVGYFCESASAIGVV